MGHGRLFGEAKIPKIYENYLEFNFSMFYLKNITIISLLVRM
jgi:hypothetical protein